MSYFKYADNAEIILFLISFFGWTVKLFLMMSIIIELRQTTRDQNSKRVEVFMVKWMSYHMSLMLVIFTFILCTAGWTILHSPPPPPLEGTQSYGTVMLLIVIASLLTFHAFGASWWWRKLALGNYNGKHSSTAKAVRVTSGETTVTVPVTLKTEVVASEDEIAVVQQDNDTQQNDDKKEQDDK